MYVCVYVVTPGPLSTTDATPIAKLLFSSVTPCVVLLNGPGRWGRAKRRITLLIFRVTLSTGVDCRVLDGRLANEKNADPRVLKKSPAYNIFLKEKL